MTAFVTGNAASGFGHDFEELRMLCPMLILTSVSVLQAVRKQ